MPARNLRPQGGRAGNPEGGNGPRLRLVGLVYLDEVVSFSACRLSSRYFRSIQESLYRLYTTNATVVISRANQNYELHKTNVANS